MSKMPAILINYNFSPEWLKDYPELDVTIYDRSDDNIERDLTQYGKVYKTKNIGDVDYDKLSYLIENYDNLPEVFLWGKTNLFPRFVEESDFKKALQANTFAPLLRYDHRIYDDKFGQVNMYRGEMYYERADDWLFNNPALDKRCPGWEAWCLEFGLPVEAYIPFPPGGNFLLTRDRIHKYSRDMYEKMRDTLPYAMHPVEAHLCERSYYLLWR